MNPPGENGKDGLPNPPPLGEVIRKIEDWLQENNRTIPRNRKIDGVMDQLISKVSVAQEKESPPLITRILTHSELILSASDKIRAQRKGSIGRNSAIAQKKNGGHPMSATENNLTSKFTQKAFTRDGAGDNGRSMDAIPHEDPLGHDPANVSSNKNTSIMNLGPTVKNTAFVMEGVSHTGRSVQEIQPALTPSGLHHRTGIVDPGEVFSAERLPAYVTEQAGKQIARSMLRGEKTVKLQLKPPELGSLKVEMDIKGQSLKLGLFTESDTTRDFLASHIHMLKEALVDNGIKLERFDIEIRHDFEQSLTDFKGNPRHYKQRHQGIHGTPPMSEENTDALDRSIGLMKASYGLGMVDILA